jgi:hypothetical protein
MGNVEHWTAVFAVAAAACGPDGYREHRSGSLFLMNQTHEAQLLSLFRPAALDCVRTARDPEAELSRTSYDIERCVTLAPAELVALDLDPYAEVAPLCEAAAIEGARLAPRALFWIDTESVGSNDTDAVIAIVSVGDALELDPIESADVVPLAELPETPCR